MNNWTSRKQFEMLHFEGVRRCMDYLLVQNSVDVTKIKEVLKYISPGLRHQRTLLFVEFS